MMNWSMRLRRVSARFEAPFISALRFCLPHLFRKRLRNYSCWDCPQRHLLRLLVILSVLRLTVDGRLRRKACRILYRSTTSRYWRTAVQQVAGNNVDVCISDSPSEQKLSQKARVNSVKKRRGRWTNSAASASACACGSSGIKLYRTLDHHQ